MTLNIDILQTRLAILNISSDAGWLPRISSDETEMLAFVLPKTAKTATVQLGFSIACHRHDQAVGAGNYHLFRVATPLEERISHALNQYQTQDLPLNSTEQSIAFLTKLTEGMAIDSQSGPVRIGLYTDLIHNPTDTITCLAKHYLLAYHEGYQTFPYFS